VSDPEIEAMAAVSSAFSTLEDDARGRVLRWAADKYGVSYVGMAGSVAQVEQSALEVNGVEGHDMGEVANDATESAKYEHFADLYAAAAPTTKQTRVLVAAYWFQKIKGQDTSTTSQKRCRQTSTRSLNWYCRYGRTETRGERPISYRAKESRWLNR
jgi:hypothetical protein